MSGWFGLGADRVEVGRSSVLTLREGNKLVASALNDGKGDEVARHFSGNSQVSVSSQSVPILLR
jgi:hypothetical protein